jgi:hypothetical protein
MSRQNPPGGAYSGHGDTCGFVSHKYGFKDITEVLNKQKAPGRRMNTAFLANTALRQGSRWNGRAAGGVFRNTPEPGLGSFPKIYPDGMGSVPRDGYHPKLSKRRI